MVSLPAVVALAAVATMGYLIGRQRRLERSELDHRAKREIRRAQQVSRQLELIAQSIRRDLASHHAALARFRARVASLAQEPDDQAWRNLCKEAEQMLGPTLHLASQMVLAYDQIRQQSNHLMAFAEVRTDPLTGVANRRVLDDTLNSLVALRNRYGARFSMILVDLDHFKRINDERGHLAGDQALRDVAQLLDQEVRETDVVARFGGEEFAILLPQTELAGAGVLAERLRLGVARQLGLSISAGATVSLDGDTSERVLARADAALYAAKEAGRDRVFVHNGSELMPYVRLESHLGAANSAESGVCA